MASFVHRKVEAILVRNFIIRIQQDEGEETQWKAGPYMEQIKICGVTISYWGEKGTLMLQGQREKTLELNQQFIDFSQEYKGSENMQNTQTGKAKEKEMNRPTITKEETEVMRAEMMNEIQLKTQALMMYIANWKSKRETDNTLEWESQSILTKYRHEIVPTTEEEVREKRAVDEFKEELLRHIQKEILQWANSGNSKPRTEEKRKS